MGTLVLLGIDVVGQSEDEVCIDVGVWIDTPFSEMEDNLFDIPISLWADNNGMELDEVCDTEGIISGVPKQDPRVNIIISDLRRYRKDNTQFTLVESIK
jgi:hypothetical protein